MKGLTDLPQDMGFRLVQDVCQGGILFSHAWWQCAGWGRRLTVQRKEGFPFVFGGH